MFPIILPLAGAAFVVMLQLTLVCEGWPLRRLGSFAGGLTALLAAWTVAVVLFLTLADIDAPSGSGLVSRHGPIPSATLGAVLDLVGMWQGWLFIVWRGWPFSAVRIRSARIVAGNLVVVGGAVATHVAARAAGLAPPRQIALAGCVTAAALVFGMLFEGWLPSGVPPGWRRFAALVVVVAGAAVLYTALDAYADRRHWTTIAPDDWIAHATFNAIALSVILHVAVGRRWPFAPSHPVSGGGPIPGRQDGHELPPFRRADGLR